MPMTLTGLQALSVVMPMTVSMGRSNSEMARTRFSAPSMLVRHGLPGEVLAARDLLERGGGEDDVGVAGGAHHAGVVAHVADHEPQALLRVLEDDLVGRDVPVHELEAHVVLLGLVAREDGDALRDALGAGHEPPGEHLAERAGAAGDEDSLAFEELGHEPPGSCERECFSIVAVVVRPHRVLSIDTLGGSVPRFSIVIPAYNAESTLRETLACGACSALR